MFVGHFGAALAGPALAPRARLWQCMFAALWLDVLFPWMALFGVEHAHVEPGARGIFPIVLDHLPWSHGLLMTAVWCALAAIVAWTKWKDFRTTIVLVALVSSHWILDAIAHRGDMMIGISRRSPRVGLYLWDHVAATLMVELGLLAVGLAAYLRLHRETRRRELWALVCALAVLQVGFVFGPAPAAGSSSFALAAPTLGMLLPIAWAARIERAKQGADSLPN